MATLSVRTSKAICKALGRLCSSCYLAGKLMSTGNTSLAGHWLKKCAFESDARRWVSSILSPRVLLCKSRRTLRPSAHGEHTHLLPRFDEETEELEVRIP